ncbi:MAG: xanthine dehydrogenase family protein molybdopterin-binding subunit [Nitrososphaeria archaeon]
MVISVTINREALELDRIDASDKIAGNIRYVGDMVEVDAYYVKVVRSAYAHAEILSIDVSEASKYARIITANDIPGEKLIGFLIRDQPLLAYDKVRYYGEPVALSVSEDIRRAKAGAELVKIEYRPLKPIFTIEEALDPNTVRIYEKGNLKASFRISNGNVDEGFKTSDVVLEDKYEFPHQEHAYLETEACLAIPEKDNMTVIGSMQVPFAVEKAVRLVLGNAVKNVRVIQSPTGGGFGGKEDAPDEVCAQAALAAYVTGKPCFLMNNRKESFVGHHKRHPGYIIRKIGATKDGKLQSLVSSVYLDGGAYTSLSPRVLFQALFASIGPYYIPNVYVEGYAVYTNKVPSGAFRGFGNPQGLFAAEVQMNELAKELGMDPVELRLKNLVTPNGYTSWGQRLTFDVGARECLLTAVQKFGGLGGRTDNTGTKRRGVGVAMVIHGQSIGPLGLDVGSAIVELADDGRVEVKVALTEYGQGIHTGWVQIVSKATNLSPNVIRVVYPDTGIMYDSGPTVASRSTIVGGRALLEASLQFKNELIKAASDIYGKRPNELYIDGEKVRSRDGEFYSLVEIAKALRAHGRKVIGEGWFNMNYGEYWNEAKGQGVPWKSYAFAAHIAEVEVDTETGRVEVLRYCAVQDVGKVLNRKLATSQVYGGVIQGLGYALSEELRFDEKGALVVNSFIDYMIPTFADTPREFCVDFVETYNEDGPFGAKGLGEVPIEPVAAVIASAVADAIGRPIRSIPVTPERVLRALGKLGDEQ